MLGNGVLLALAIRRACEEDEMRRRMAVEPLHSCEMCGRDLVMAEGDMCDRCQRAVEERYADRLGW